MTHRAPVQAKRFALHITRLLGGYPASRVARRAREYQAESQSDREPDPPHGSSVRMAGGYTEFNDANSDAHKMMVVPRRTCPIGAPCLLATGHVDAALEVRAVVDGNSRGCDVSFD